MAPAIVLEVRAFSLPESPHWLMDHGKPEKTPKTMARLYTDGDATEGIHGRAEYDLASIEIVDDIAARSLRELFNNPANTRCIIIFACLHMPDTNTDEGRTAFQYFSPSTFAQITISSGQTLLY
ncbi:hypothetical protein DL765_005368 [Monosporascus sp. GIB2]|nr:hypothetical protein DL765_005368 [Monosporascus sp. GIB2]